MYYSFRHCSTCCDAYLAYIKSHLSMAFPKSFHLLSCGILVSRGFLLTMKIFLRFLMCRNQITSSDRRIILERAVFVCFFKVLPMHRAIKMAKMYSMYGFFPSHAKRKHCSRTRSSRAAWLPTPRSGWTEMVILYSNNYHRSSLCFIFRLWYTFIFYVMF